MKKSKLLIFVLPALLFLGSCHKIEQVSSTPSIKYLSFTIFDTTDILGNNLKGGKLHFSFEDGDGDLGIDTNTGDQTDTTNLFFSLYRIKNNVAVAATSDDPLYPSAYRIPYMERQGQDKVLHGTIDITFMYLFYNDSDTIQYDFFIRDRGKHNSNTAKTSRVIIAIDSVYTKVTP
jgi:hypothetical protein